MSRPPSGTSRGAPPAAFTTRVLAVVGRIPSGRVVTYGDVARLAGRPGAARAVGQIMATARRPGLPYHRVVAAGGRLGGYGDSPAIKAALLRAEGVGIREGRRIVKFGGVRWSPATDGTDHDRPAPPAAGPTRRAARRRG